MFSRKFSSLAVTTPIFYANAPPHIGHAYTMTLADAISRWHVIRNGPLATSHLYTGTDEHGQKVYESALNAKMSPKHWCDVVSEDFRTLPSLLGIRPTQFIRTTEPAHQRAVETLWRRLREVGDIYPGVHGGWYCVSEETFYPEHQLIDTPNGKIVKENGKQVKWVEERNYMFKLSRYRERIREWLDSGVAVPAERRNDLKEYLDKELEDISVSRKREVAKWGIPVPEDPEQMIYVWLDALTNYLTVTGYPDSIKTPDIHVVGKDIFKYHGNTV